MYAGVAHDPTSVEVMDANLVSFAYDGDRASLLCGDYGLKYVVCDLVGRTLLEENLEPGLNQLNLPACHSGLSVLAVFDRTGRTVKTFRLEN